MKIRILVWDADNVSRNTSEIRKFTDEVTGSQNWRPEDDNDIPVDSVVLGQNWPNPFN